jgi:hypothetical protein
MRVKAIASNGLVLSDKTIKAFHNSGCDYQITIGEIYTVYGILIWKNIIHYIVFDRWRSNPFPHPAELYQITDNRLPKEWYYNFYGYTTEDEINAVWGYKELVLQHEHYFKLMERDHEALDIFFTRQEEIDKFHES